MDENLKLVRKAIKKLCNLTVVEERECRHEFTNMTSRRDKMLVEPDYRSFIQTKYRWMMPNANREKIDRIVNVKVSQIKKIDRDEDGVMAAKEFLQSVMLSKLDQTICEENDFENEVTLEELKKWLKTKCNIPDDKLDECAKSVKEGTYDGKEKIDPYDLTAKLFNFMLNKTWK